MNTIARILVCAGMRRGDGNVCLHPVTHIDHKGYVYCTGCGLLRRQSGTPCRKLLMREIHQLQRGEPIPWRSQAPAKPEAPEIAAKLEALAKRRPVDADNITRSLRKYRREKDATMIERTLETLDAFLTWPLVTP